MSIARHHNEWLSLIEISGPFLSMPVLMRVFPQGLDPRDSSKAKELSIAYEEWRGNPIAPGHHRAWVEFVLIRILEYPKELLAEGQSLPPDIKVVMEIYGETLRPDIAIIGPPDTPAAGNPQVLIQIFPHTQNLESPIPGRLWKDSPATRMVELLRGTGVLLGLVTNGEEWMLVHAMPGETLGFATWRADIWQEEHITLRAFHSLLHCRRFFGVAENDTIASLLKESAQDQQEVTDQLGYQVRSAVEVLVQAFDLLDQESGRKLLAGLDEKTIYDASLTLMMRLVFLFCAEERGLLRLGEPLYDDFYAVSTLRERLRETADQQGEEILERRSDAWARLLATFRAVHGGVEHESMRLIAYGGTLFDPDRYPFLEGRPPDTNWRETSVEPPAINNRVVLHLLESLQILRVKVPGGGPAEARRISFSGLDIGQIGHVYESLLDHTAVRAQTVFLGLKGTRNAEPELSLELLEKNHAAPGDKFIEFLREETGRSEQSLRRDLDLEIVSAKRAKKNLQGFISSNDFSDHILLVSCHNNQALFNRIKPFQGLIRSDDFGRPVLMHPGSIFVTKGSERRSTGTHYTPRSLTEPIVQYTLEPLVYVGPAEGKPKDQWKLKSPRELLELKVCDMAMGSGAFLVQSCRYLSERLAEAWEELEKANPSKILATPEGDLSTGHPSERLIPIDPDERLAIARRYVADRCLYGVDINPMAVEMAKLSLWLITLQRDRPFTFLNHAFKCGDSLLGVTSFKQIENFSLRPGEQQMTFATANLFRFMEEASAKRRALEDLPSNDHTQIETKNRLHAEAEAATGKVKALADSLVAFELRGLDGELYKEQRAAIADLAEEAMRKPMSEFQAYACEQLRGRRTFHWPVEFPEVFARGGFDALVGNPPYQGGSKITAVYGTDYRDFLVRFIADGVKGNADLCGYFVLQVIDLVRENGGAGFVVTSAISEGVTREVALDQLLKQNFCVPRANTIRIWPGTASVTYSSLWLSRGEWHGEFLLDGKSVHAINSFLAEGTDKAVFALAANLGKASKGVQANGMGFVLDRQEAESILKSDSRYHQVLMPYLTGEEVNSKHDHSAERYAINFFDWPLSKEVAPKNYHGPVASDFPRCLAIVEERVKPERDTLSPSNKLRQKWWLYERARLAFYKQIEGNQRVLGISTQATKYVAFAWLDPATVFSYSMALIATNSDGLFAILNSTFYDTWVRFYTSKNLMLIRYIIEDCFEKYPFPPHSADLDLCGIHYNTVRTSVMKSRKDGLTDIYNYFHDPDEKSEDIARLRTLHADMDHAVAAAYGWSDLDLGHGFHETKQGIRFTLSELARRTVLERLLTLNHRRYEEEVKAGPHEKKAKSFKRNSGKKSGGDIIGQARLLPDE